MNNSILHRRFAMFSVASSTFLIVITYCAIPTNLAASSENSTQSPQPLYNVHKAQQLYLVLQKPGSPLKPYTSITNRMEQEVIPSADEAEEIKEKLSKVPGGIGIYPKGIPCSFFIKNIMEEAMRTANYLTEIPTRVEFLKTCTLLRDIVNEEIYVYALINAMLNRLDTKYTPLPSIEHIYPHYFMPATVINEARRKVMTASSENETIVVEYGFEKSSYPNPEDQLAYFREDINVNSQHYYWHEFYPPDYSAEFYKILKDRKGELFFYLHRQFIARYDAERNSVNLSNVVPFDNYSIPLAEGYDPKLLNNISGNYWLARAPNRTVVDVPGIELYISDLKRILRNIYNLTDYGNLPQSQALTIIGDVTEPNTKSKYYNEADFGNYHGTGHIAISRCENPNEIEDPTDPAQKFSGVGVMYNIPVSMRDPSFYRWHKHIDDIAARYQLLLQPYTDEELSFPNITITNISVRGAATDMPNLLTTFWQKRKVYIQKGVDFGGENPVLVNVLHLQHEPFSYNITVSNEDTVNITVTVRLFIAPKYDIYGVEIPFEEQRKQFISMDTFLATVAPGTQQIIRKSQDSRLTIPLGLSFEQLGNLTNIRDKDNYCGCGWPDHLLLPKGKPSGMTFIYLAMITDGKDYNETYTDNYGCVTAPTLCGLVGQKYPDSRPMGYPFDRRANDSILTIYNFASRPNIKASEIIIKHIP